LAETNERLAIVETKLDNIITLLETHVNEPSCEKCELSDDMTAVQTDVVWLKRIGFTVGTLASSAIVGLLLDKFADKIF